MINKMLYKLCVCMGISLMPALALAGEGDPFEGSGFVHEDWQVVCDNTLTCRAVGYTKEDVDYWAHPASLMLEVEPKAYLPKAYVNYIEEGSAPAYLWVNDKNYGKVAIDTPLTDQQTQAILGTVKKNSNIEIRIGATRLQISDQGMTAVLLKLDEIQGRVGTPLGLVEKGNRQIKHAFAPIAMPSVTAYPVRMPRDAYQAQANITQLKANINQLALTTLQDDDIYCYELTQKQDKPSADNAWQFYPLSDSQVLAEHLCWRGAYNEGYGYWLWDANKPSNIALITDIGSDFDDGILRADHKGRGVGDCWSHTMWVWNGQTFLKTEEFTSGMCRGFAGGAWRLPTYVIEVR